MMLCKRGGNRKDLCGVVRILWCGGSDGGIGCEADRERDCGREELRFFADGNGSGGRLEPSAIVDGFQFKIG